MKFNNKTNKILVMIVITLLSAIRVVELLHSNEKKKLIAYTRIFTCKQL